MPEKILLVDDVPANLSVLTAALEPEGYEILAASNGMDALKVAARAHPALIILDVVMPGMNGIETCRRLKQLGDIKDVPVIFITARSEMESIVEGFRAGGVDYIVKPFQTEEVLVRVTTHLRLSRLTRELREKNRALEVRTQELSTEVQRRRNAETALKQADDHLSVFSDLEAERWNIGGMIGGSTHMRRIVADIQRLHQFANTSVLITGESGTGKELIARAIHFGSTRARAPFVPVNCVAIPSELAESMLFGHVKGAFTGATHDRKGFFELAHGGTLFLDEIGDMPSTLQVKLLRVLEDGCVTPVGASQSKKVDVRIVAATNADLDERIESGAFRRDLYFRLARYVVNSVPLRMRSEDISVLATHFLRLFAAEMSIKAPQLDSDALEALATYDFPGNVRELKNIIERALIESSGGIITCEHLHLKPRRQSVAATTKPSGHEAASPAPLPLNLAVAEEQLIQRALQETGGNIAEAARLLGVHRTRIYRKLAQDESGATGSANNAG